VAIGPLVRPAGEGRSPAPLRFGLAEAPASFPGGPMQTGAITGYIDVAQVTLYVFWAFLRRPHFLASAEDKREGYRSSRTAPASSWCRASRPCRAPKTFLVRDGHTYTAPPGNIDNRPSRRSPNPGPARRCGRPAIRCSPASVRPPGSSARIAPT
jgi:hypothetical protein